MREKDERKSKVMDISDITEQGIQEMADNMRNSVVSDAKKMFYSNTLYVLKSLKGGLTRHEVAERKKSKWYAEFVASSAGNVYGTKEDIDNFMPMSQRVRLGFFAFRVVDFDQYRKDIAKKEEKTSEKGQKETKNSGSVLNKVPSREKILSTSIVAQVNNVKSLLNLFNERSTPHILLSAMLAEYDAFRVELGKKFVSLANANRVPLEATCENCRSYEDTEKAKFAGVEHHHYLYYCDHCGEITSVPAPVEEGEEEEDDE